MWPGSRRRRQCGRDKDTLIYWVSAFPADWSNGAIWADFGVTFDGAGYDGFRTVIEKDTDKDLAYSISEIVFTTAPSRWPALPKLR